MSEIIDAIEEIKAIQEKMVDDLQILVGSEISQETLEDLEAIKKGQLEIIESIDYLIEINK